MHTQEVKIKYFEPRMATITVESENVLSTVEVEDIAIKEFEDKFPEGVDAIVEEVIEIS